MSGSTLQPTSAIAKSAVESTDKLWDLVREANRGDKTSISTLQDVLKGPHGELIVKTCGDLARQSEISLLHASFAESPGTQNIVQETLDRMRSELGWARASKLEQLLIERIVLTWLHMHIVEMKQSQAEDPSAKLMRYFDERIDRLQRRHLAAIKCLATVRKLAVPAERLTFG